VCVCVCVCVCNVPFVAVSLIVQHLVCFAMMQVAAAADRTEQQAQELARTLEEDLKSADRRREEQLQNVVKKASQSM